MVQDNNVQLVTTGILTVTPATEVVIHSQDLSKEDVLMGVLAEKSYVFDVMVQRKSPNHHEYY